MREDRKYMFGTSKAIHRVCKSGRMSEPKKAQEGNQFQANEFVSAMSESAEANL
jgi:hypothetical protein